MSLSNKDISRARKLKIKLFTMGISVTDAARKLNVTRIWLSNVLNERGESEGLLDRLEEMIEEEDPELRIAA